MAVNLSVTALRKTLLAGLVTSNCLVSNNGIPNIHTIPIASRPRFAFFFFCCISASYYSGEGYAFRRDGRYFILAERHKSKDTVGIYDTAESYRLVRVGNYVSVRATYLTICLALSVANGIHVVAVNITYRKSLGDMGGSSGGSSVDIRDEA